MIYECLDNDLESGTHGCYSSPVAAIKSNWLACMGEVFWRARENLLSDSGLVQQAKCMKTEEVQTDENSSLESIYFHDCCDSVSIVLGAQLAVRTIMCHPRWLLS